MRRNNNISASNIKKSISKTKKKYPITNIKGQHLNKDLFISENGFWLK